MTHRMGRRADVFITAADVMARFAISRRTLDRWIETSGFPAPRRIRAKRYFMLSEVNEWAEQQTGQPIERGEQVFGMDVVSDVIQDYPGFVDAMVARRDALNLSAVEAEAKAGLQEGYLAKLENPTARYGRGMGKDIMPLWLGGLRVGFVLVDLPRRPHRLHKGS